MPQDETLSSNVSGSSDVEMETLRYISDILSVTSSLEDYSYLGVKKIILKHSIPLPFSAPVKWLLTLAGHIFSLKRRKLSNAMFKSLIIKKNMQIISEQWL